MTTFVVDTSVIAKWALPPVDEPLTEFAFQLLKAYVAEQVRLIEPDFFWAELANVFWKAVRRGRWSRQSAEEALRLTLERDILSVPSADLVEGALQISLGSPHQVYDCMFIALAISSGSTMITADERLANKFAARFPVKWLGALRLQL